MLCPCCNPAHVPHAAASIAHLRMAALGVRASVGALALADSLKGLEMAAAAGNLLRVIDQTEQTAQLLHNTIDLVRAELTSLQQESNRAG